jgi:tetraacyldisaccharide 4'-kinase
VKGAHPFVQRYWRGELGVRGGVLDAVLAPVEAVYGAGVRVRNHAFDTGRTARVRARIPVISIGNITVGGTGKTPFAHHIAELLRARGRRPAIVHGGYAADEPALHRRWSPAIPVIVARDRARAVADAAERGADVAVLDDGFQHRRLERDLDIVLVAAERWDRRPRLLPRGPWREPPASLCRAGLVAVVRKAGSAVEAAAVAGEVRGITGREALRLHLRSAGWRAVGSSAAGDRPAAPALLVCALADPDLFRRSALEAGADIADLVAFPDHHAYSAADARRVLRRAGDRPIVTTEKDWVKLEGMLAAAAVYILAQAVVLECGAAALDSALDRVVA